MGDLLEDEVSTLMNKIYGKKPADIVDLDG